MVNYDQPFAIARFLESDTFSEVPSNWLYEEKNKILCWWPVKVKNVTSYISNRIPPDESTWEMCEVEIETYCDTWEKARKIADDPMYRTTDDEDLGKGRRTKINNTRFSSSPEDSIKKNEITKSNKVKKKGEYSKPIITSCITVPPMLTTKDIESSNIIFDGNINVINAADANSFPVTCVNNLESDKEILQIARDIAIIKGIPQILILHENRL
ncbi:PREDICTED: uncharacterized protein LOC108759712 [Trachymyrmex cornetzi]|uniref:uncharacterized protein LOC108759712 n=1 Tax=Trachymyrmex cornetzi TaxID=471704 RepID=UPI00084F527A|nr:PREDICTED: uncharacterized protein LOC108759712 [Trachymyrmex cornetzi]